MSTLQTDFTRLLGMKTDRCAGKHVRVLKLKSPFSGIQTPIVLAPMAGASGGALASEVSLAGGFAFLAPSPGKAWSLPTRGGELVAEEVWHHSSLYRGREIQGRVRHRTVDAQ
jgi:hypothetical protein